MRRLAALLAVSGVVLAFLALGYTAAWSLLHYRPYPMDGDSMIQAMKSMQDIAELRATAENLAWRKDLVTGDFNQVFPAACIALIVASVFGAAGFAWILFRMTKQHRPTTGPNLSDRAL